jgi:predicted nuclease of restriction endonuclease-like (RecB) superfamily
LCNNLLHKFSIGVSLGQGPHITHISDPEACHLWECPQLPWGHHVRILDNVKDPAEREWYIRQTIQNGWSRNVLVHQIGGDLYRRQGKALTNFSRTLPEPQSELAQQLIKDPYNFDFLTLGPEMLERDLERGLIEHVRDFILELGKGFAFLG